MTELMCNDRAPCAQISKHKNKLIGQKFITFYKTLGKEANAFMYIFLKIVSIQMNQRSNAKVLLASRSKPNFGEVVADIFSDLNLE